MSKQGSGTLHHALMNATHNVVNNNSTFKAYHDVKRTEHQTHYNALGYYTGKLVRFIKKMPTN